MRVWNSAASRQLQPIILNVSGLRHSCCLSNKTTRTTNTPSPANSRCSSNPKLKIQDSLSRLLLSSHQRATDERNHNLLIFGWRSQSIPPWGHKATAWIETPTCPALLLVQIPVRAYDQFSRPSTRVVSFSRHRFILARWWKLDTHATWAPSVSDACCILFRTTCEVK